MVFEDGEHDKPSGSIKDRLMRMFIPSSEDTAMSADAPETTVDSICCVNCGHSQPQAAQLQKEVHSLRRMLNSLHEQMDRQALEHRQSFEQMARRVKQKDTEIERIQAWRRQVIDTFLNGPPQ
jgi:Zn ribbon nucleic-acid-binding protein